MNTPNPLQPQGSLPPRAKSSIYFKILMILAVHVVVIGGLLLQGCKENKVSSAPKDDFATTTGTSSPMSTNTDFSAPPTPAAPVAVQGMPPATGAQAGAMPTAPAGNVPAQITPPVLSQVQPAAPSVSASGAGKEYVIAAGDMLFSIAKKNGVTLKALMEANPGVDPKKLQVGHKLQIPAGSSVAASTPASTSSPALAATESSSGSADGSSYTVKSGDRLLKIAATHGTTVKAILALNEMKTTSIKTGQKLKLPMRVASAETTPAAAPSAAAPAATGATSAPATTAN